jgi:DNA-binding transcriptional LysR family regulator
METRYLKTLVVAAESGSFSRAAESLHITQSAVSQRIKFLEDRYGHQLLDRSTPTLVPTDVGRMVLEKARMVLDKEHELLEELRHYDGAKRLSFCCTPTFGTAYLPEVLNGFLLEHTDLADLKCIFHQPEVALRGLEKHDYDLAVIEHCDSLDLSAYITYALPRDELVMVSSPALNLGGSVEIGQLLPCRLYARKEGCSSKQLLQQNLASVGQDFSHFKGVIVSDDLRLTIQTVMAGSGISFLSRSLVRSQLLTGELVASHVRGFDHLRCRSVVLAPGGSTNEVASWFLDSLFAVFDRESQVQGEAGHTGCATGRFIMGNVDRVKLMA